MIESAVLVVLMRRLVMIVNTSQKQAKYEQEE